MVSAVVKGKKSENGDIDSRFESLASLPTRILHPQCIMHNQEILICGGNYVSDCYSYNILNNKWKIINSYPKSILLIGHCVVKLHSNKKANEMTLLSFGGQQNHALTMSYRSVWDNKDKRKHVNQWFPLTKRNGKRVSIGRKQDDYEGARAIVGGANNHLLFITHPPKNMAVFNLDTFQMVKVVQLPLSGEYNQSWYHGFVCKASTPKNAKSEMILFCERKVLLIEYDEDNSNHFRCNDMVTYATTQPCSEYAYVRVDCSVLFFGGCSKDGTADSKTVYRYSVEHNNWMKYDATMPLPLRACTSVLSEDCSFVYIIGGGRDYNKQETALLLRTKVQDWMKQPTTTEAQWMAQQKQRAELVTIRKELEGINEYFNVKDWKVKNVIQKKKYVKFAIDYLQKKKKKN
ncbi:hypothetical protein RFI_16717 [Reticulomyxa filosa]|uniref:Kelch motif family protein n=1 Tax=Reticulomyxa filosa TaxID=46433 RepID=X6N2L2_RETFI|nr:hypothetical protein RFI_16717 [Reticulomyxa filosa]|eukprot:ETO20500.1 hypothetical protein RFI_16717 [Reticulomyxa filosa]